MHGMFPNYLDMDHVDVELSFKWMKHTGLKWETEGLITAAQDQALNTRYYSKHIIKQGTTDRCRMCHTQPETVEHIISGCQTLAADQYINRHNQVAAQFHLDICRHYGIIGEAECWYQHKPEWVIENEKATILWDSPIITDRHECHRIWNKTLEVMPVIIGATGIVDKNFKKYVGRILGCHNICSLQRSAIPGTAHILRKVMSIKPD